MTARTRAKAHACRQMYAHARRRDIVRPGHCAQAGLPLPSLSLPGRRPPGGRPITSPGRAGGGWGHPRPWPRFSPGVDRGVDDPVAGRGIRLVVGPEQLWTACAASLRTQVSDAAWRTWFEDARAVSVDDGRLVLAVPSSLVKERIQTRYLPLVRDALEDTTGASYDVILEVRTDDEDLGEPAVTIIATEVASPASAEITAIRRPGDRS